MSAIDEMAKRAAEEYVRGWPEDDPSSDMKIERTQLAVIIARHYREGVRGLVLAARKHICPDGCSICKRLRKALEKFRDVE